jgi:hypothetical protein
MDARVTQAQKRNDTKTSNTTQLKHRRTACCVRAEWYHSSTEKILEVILAETAPGLASVTSAGSAAQNVTTHSMPRWVFMRHVKPDNFKMRAQMPMVC